MAIASDNAGGGVGKQPMYDDTPYIHATSNLQVPGLFRNFHTAATLLRVARSELKVTLLGDDGERIVTNFYDLLQKVETSIHGLSTKVHKLMHEKFIVEVEGLDGSGKTSLVQSLAETFQGAPMKTPSSSLSEIRPLWDHRGGILARAFYFITNYVLEYEISNGLIEAEVIVIDRWYASTLAYTVAYRPDKDHFSMEDLPNDNFQWPSDLNLRPHVMLLLNIDPETRQARVENRKVLGGGASRFNPWDDRLANNLALGQRIMTAMKNIQGPLQTHILNANGTKVEVLNDALEVVRSQYKQARQPELYYKHDPLMWWRHDGIRLGLCNEQGRRAHHALWNLQVSFGKLDAPPVLKTVGLNHIDSHGIYYWSSSSLLDDDLGNHGVVGSVLCCAGSYPLEHQWRAEGFFTKVTKNECLLYGHNPPPSLSRHIAACEESIKSDNLLYCRPERDDSYDENVRNLNGKNCTPSTMNLWRFIPIRIEVLRGGPSTRISSYPERWEWIHKDGTWCMRSILPFTPVLSSKTTSFLNQPWNLKNCTIAFMGTHTSGKTTLGKRLSTLMGWRFDEELGKILREEDKLVANGHVYGDGKGNDKDQWDERIFQKECERDLSQECRIVETWHGGNAAWNYFRRKKKLTQEEFRSTVLPHYLGAMTKHAESTIVLMIFLSIDSTDTIMDRRSKDQTAMDRLPLQDEREDAQSLLCLNDKYFYEHIAREAKIPLLVIENMEYGEEAIEKTLKSILYFAQANSFRRVEIKEN